MGEQTYFILYMLHDVSHDPAIWTYKFHNEYTDLNQALKIFHQQCGVYINDPKYDMTTVILQDATGNQIETNCWIKNSTPVPVEE